MLLEDTYCQQVMLGLLDKEPTFALVFYISAKLKSSNSV
jgi:hypothetical protein